MQHPQVLTLVSSEFVATRVKALRERAPHVDVVTSLDEADPARIDAVLAFKLPSGVAPRLPHLKMVASVGAGVDGLLEAGDIPAHVAVTRAHDAGLGLSMAQYVTYQILRSFRGFAALEAQASQSQWVRRPVPDARQHTVGLMGVGEIGRTVARALDAMGFRVTGWSRTGSAAGAVSRMFVGEAQLASFLGECDSMVCLLPFTPATRNLLDGSLLGKLKPGAFVVNAARGGIVVEHDLLALLDSGHLSGAALDVFATEPLPSDSPLWGHPRVTVTPHIAAQPAIAPTVDQFIENLARIRRGQLPLHAIDRHCGY